jgi:hypothetical protein
MKNSKKAKLKKEKAKKPEIVGQWLVDQWNKYATQDNATALSTRMGCHSWNEDYSKTDCQLIIAECNKKGVTVDEKEFWESYNLGGPR